MLCDSYNNWVRTRKSPSPHSNLMPWARGRLLLKLMVHVERRMYCFHESEPDSRPPPVSFSPPKAPPISAPEVGMFTLTIPQSLPLGLKRMR